MSQKNDLLIYATEYIIDAGNETAPGLTKLAVYKLLFLLSRRLKEQGIDMKLEYVPHQKKPSINSIVIREMKYL